MRDRHAEECHAEESAQGNHGDRRHRRHERFARAVDGGLADPALADPALAGELAVVDVLRRAGADLDQELSTRRPGTASGNACSRRPRPRATSPGRPRAAGRLRSPPRCAWCSRWPGMSLLLSRDALPGDALYGIKRTAESASLGLTFGDESQGAQAPRVRRRAGHRDRDAGDATRAGGDHWRLPDRADRLRHRRRGRLPPADRAGRALRRPAAVRSDWARHAGHPAGRGQAARRGLRPRGEPRSPCSTGSSVGRALSAGGPLLPDHHAARPTTSARCPCCERVRPARRSSPERAASRLPSAARSPQPTAGSRPLRRASRARRRPPPCRRRRCRPGAGSQ